MGKMVHAMFNPSSSAIWLDCGLHHKYKVAALEADATWDTSGEAAKRGTMQHDVMEYALPYYRSGLTINKAVERAIKKTTHKIRKEEVSNCRIALQSIIDITPDDMEIEVELKVPLSHEPESNGHIDVAGYCEDHVLVADYKFGQMAVSPNAPQLKIYASNTLVLLREQGVVFTPDSKVKIAIIQPQLHKEALVRVFTAGDLIKFQSYVEGVVFGQTDGHDRRGAGSLQTCEWCPAKKFCYHRPNLVGSMLADLNSKSSMSRPVIEEIVKSRSAFKKVIDECVATVAADEEGYPNWTRVEVSNGRKWSPLIEVSEIESQLIDAGVEDLHTLRSPAQVRDGNEGVETLVDELTLDQGHHIRLYPGAPKVGTPKSEPAKRPKVVRPKVPKKSAKKAAKKKPSKKSPRKKAAKKKARKRT
jgi:hypothetical protein